MEEITDKKLITTFNSKINFSRLSLQERHILFFHLSFYATCERNRVGRIDRQTDG
jgi:hypothetical protein